MAMRLPSTGSTAPWIWLAAGEARNTMALATSVGKCVNQRVDYGGETPSKRCASPPHVAAQRMSARYGTGHLGVLSLTDLAGR